jgi:hypothetical protein
LSDICPTASFINFIVRNFVILTVNFDLFVVKMLDLHIAIQTTDLYVKIIDLYFVIKIIGLYFAIPTID